MQIFTKAVRYVVMACLVTVTFFRGHELLVFSVLALVTLVAWALKNRHRFYPRGRRDRHGPAQEQRLEEPVSEDEPERFALESPMREEAPASEEPQADAEAWCDLIARKPLYKICGHLKEKGFDALSIAEDGTVSALCGETIDPLFRLGSMPPKEYWPKLADLLTDEEHLAENAGDTIVLKW